MNFPRDAPLFPRARVCYNGHWKGTGDAYGAVNGASFAGARLGARPRGLSGMPGILSGRDLAGRDARPLPRRQVPQGRVPPGQLGQRARRARAQLLARTLHALRRGLRHPRPHRRLLGALREARFSRHGRPRARRAHPRPLLQRRAADGLPPLRRIPGAGAHLRAFAPGRAARRPSHAHCAGAFQVARRPVFLLRGAHARSTVDVAYVGRFIARMVPEFDRIMGRYFQ